MTIEEKLEVLVSKLKKEVKRNKMWADIRKVDGPEQPIGYHMNMNYAQGIEHAVEELERIM